MIKITLNPTPDPLQFLLVFEGRPNDTDELDELYAALMTHQFLGMAWKESNKFEALIGKIESNGPDPAGSGTV